jgi:hypothetical protein
MNARTARPELSLRVSHQTTAQRASYALLSPLLRRAASMWHSAFASRALL